jgi:hypothetical protein
MKAVAEFCGGRCGVAWTALAAALALAACAPAQALSQNGSGPAAGEPAAPGKAPAAAEKEKQRTPSYDQVTQDATLIPGRFTLYRKREKLWLELRPEQLGPPFLFGYNVVRGIGERGLYGNQMGRRYVAFFRRSGERVQLVARNEEFFAAHGTPQARFVAESFTDSLLASAPLASRPQPGTQAILVDVGALLAADIPGYLTRLETTFRMPFALDKENTAVARLVNSAQQTIVYLRAHYSVPKIPAPPLKPPEKPAPPPPQTTPDPRSVFMGFQYVFAPLPAEPMRPRLADERIGHFTMERADYTEDTRVKARRYYVKRWRLEKKDPTAALSEPRQPILFWLDRNIPEKYRGSVAAGVLEWNRAFARIGFKDAILVRQQQNADDVDQGPARRAVVHWFTGADVGFAIGPSWADPRSGEILAADIGMSDAFARSARRLVAEDLGAAPASPPFEAAVAECRDAAETTQELDFASDLIEARGLGMDSPGAEALAQAYVKETIMHEVGHVLGLRHNFRASLAYTPSELADTAFTRQYGTAASVMDYIPFNLPLAGEPRREFVMSTVGPYDDWAIEYAYRPLDAAAEARELERIASRASEPRLAYGTDEDAGAGSHYLAIDPDVNRFDLGADPLAYYRRRVQLSRELWDRLATLRLAPGESYERLTRSLKNGLRQVARVAPLAAKFVGGVIHRRDVAGSGRPLYEPVPAARQREALALITRDFLRSDSFRFAPQLLSRIGIDQFDRPADPFVPVAGLVLGVQKPILDHLMSDAVAERLLESPGRVVDGRRVLGLAELYDRLQAAIWSEALAGRDADLLRRNLQREHLQRVVAALVHPGKDTPADAVALLRDNARRLAAALRGALGKRGLGRETRAHYADSLNTLEEALKAHLQRSGA